MLSALGQPLRAEIDLAATSDELAGMKASLGSPEAFRQAGVDYNPALLGLRFAIDTRANGQAVVKLSSERPMAEPFVDLLLELNWPAGRLVREFSFLLDPPEANAPASLTAVAPVVPAVTAPSPIRRVIRSESATDASAKAAEKSSESTPERTSEAAADASPSLRVDPTMSKTAAPRATHEVKRGETLHRVASETRPQNVSLEQMLVGLFRANPEAFDGANMNRMQAGRILTIPSAEEAAALPDEEAKKIVVAQSANWEAYRRKLAQLAAKSAVKDDQDRQGATGRVTTRVEDKAAPASDTKDRLQVSKSESAAARAGAKAEEEAIAREKALKEANERIVLLEKNVSDLQKLVELKNQKLADLQKLAAAKESTPAPASETRKAEADASKAAVPEAPAPHATTAETADSAAPARQEIPATAAEPAATPEAAAPEAKPETPATSAAADAPAAVPATDATNADESLLKKLQANPILLAGAGLAAVLGLFFAFARRRQPAVTPAEEEDGSEGSDTLSANEPQEASPEPEREEAPAPVSPVIASTEVVADQSSPYAPAAAPAAAFAPVATAAYAALANDAHAAPKEDDFADAAGPTSAAPEASAAAGRADTVAVPEELPGESFAAVEGAAVEVDSPAESAVSAAEPGADAVASEPAAVAEPVSAAEEAGDTRIEDGAAVVPEEAPAFAENETPGEPGMLDFDLTPDLADAGAVNEPSEELLLSEASTDSLPQPPEAPASALPKAMLDIDFDLGATPSPATGAAVPPAPDVEAEKSSENVAEAASDELPADEEGALEFDANLADLVDVGIPDEAPVAPPFDLSSINLDLAEPAGPVEPADSADDEAATADTADSVPPDLPDPFAGRSPASPATPELAEPLDFGQEFESPAAPAEAAAPAATEPPADVEEPVNEEAETKLDLAKAYEEMGDLEGARELLEEVLAEGNTEQRERAGMTLARLEG
ncbi:hypothetical protein HCX48_01910 [Rhodocyclus tenuis]|uniref:FimV N-terminal domain-containing protein n=1 Tax=Rhodocyclus gracilis TaxID=2929842 RepID=A0ABX0WHJ1_9RHOO|nr:hypothetical protein [Rhodocyclus gracilis]